MNPFTYPSQPQVRRHGPRGYADPESYRPWLRDEFTFRCVYCLVREQWGKLRGSFDLDHFMPIATHPRQALDYDNLVYCCAGCNSAKGTQVLPNPERALVAPDVSVKDDGTLQARTRAARRLIRVLGLDDPEYTEFRLLWLEIVELAQREAPELYRKLMGYPDDLPNLARLRPPDGNARPEGVELSCFARKQSGTLPDIY